MKIGCYIIYGLMLSILMSACKSSSPSVGAFEGENRKVSSRTEQLLKDYCFFCYAHAIESDKSEGGEIEISKIEQSLDRNRQWTSGYYTTQSHLDGVDLRVKFEKAFEEYGISFYRFEAYPDAVSMFGEFVKYIGINKKGRIIHAEVGRTEYENAAKLAELTFGDISGFETSTFEELMRLFNRFAGLDEQYILTQLPPALSKAGIDINSLNKVEVVGKRMICRKIFYYADIVTFSESQKIEEVTYIYQVPGGLKVDWFRSRRISPY